MREFGKKGIWILVGAVMFALVGCSSNNYSETTPDKAQAARERIQQAEQTPPGMTK